MTVILETNLTIFFENEFVEFNQFEDFIRKPNRELYLFRSKEDQILQGFIILNKF